MKRTIIVMCTWLSAMAAHAQFSQADRVANINPLRNGDGSFMKINNPLYFNNSYPDTTSSKKRGISTTTFSGDPHALRISSIQALCNLNSLQLNWTTINGQASADHFEIQQSPDAGATWISLGTVPATRSAIGEVPYHFTYNKSLGDVDLRVVAVKITGERWVSSIIPSACSDNNLLSVENLVYSTANVRIGSPRPQNVKLVLVNQSGLPVMAKEAGLTQGINSVSLDMSGLRPGFYLLNILWPGGREDVLKVMKR